MPKIANHCRISDSVGGYLRRPMKICNTRTQLSAWKIGSRRKLGWLKNAQIPRIHLAGPTDLPAFRPKSSYFRYLHRYENSHPRTRTCEHVLRGTVISIRFRIRHASSEILVGEQSLWALVVRPRRFLLAVFVDVAKASLLPYRTSRAGGSTI